VALNPFDAQYHLRLGWEYSHQWKEEDYHTKWLPSADISMDRAAYFAGVKNPHLHQELGNYWTMRSRSVMPNDPVHHEAWAKACWHYKKAIKIEGGGRRADLPATLSPRPASRSSAEADGLARRAGVSEQGKGQKSEVRGRSSESAELKRMQKEIKAYVWNSYPDDSYIQQVLN